jgi:hypothetical protein
MYACTSAVLPASFWLRFSSASAAAMFGASRFAHITSFVICRPIAV